MLRPERDSLLSQSHASGICHVRRRRTGKHKAMITARFTMKRCLFGMMVFVAVCSSSTLPRLSRLVEQEDGAVHALAAEPVSRNSVASTHARRTQAAKGLPPKSSDTKTISNTKTMESNDRKAAQTAHALTGCNNITPAEGAPAVPGKSTARKNDNNPSNEEKNLCNPGSPRSR